MSLYTRFAPAGPSGFGPGSTAQQVTRGLDLSGRTILVTGFVEGIGRETARVLAVRGATVLGLDKSEGEAQATADELSGDVRPVACDLSEPVRVRQTALELADAGEDLDAIITNAGIMALPEFHAKHGYELQFLVNYLGHYILVTELVSTLADDGRVVVVTSASHEYAPEGGLDIEEMRREEEYHPALRYCETKLANIYLAKELARRFEREDTHQKTAVAAHPGDVNTGLHGQPGLWNKALRTVLDPFIMKNLGEGAATQVWAAAHPDAASLNGEYLVDCNVAEATEQARDPELAREFWEETEGIVQELCAGRDSNPASPP